MAPERYLHHNADMVPCRHRKQFSGFFESPRSTQASLSPLKPPCSLIQDIPSIGITVRTRNVLSRILPRRTLAVFVIKTVSLRYPSCVDGHQFPILDKANAPSEVSHDNLKDLIQSRQNGIVLCIALCLHRSETAMSLQCAMQ